MHISFHKNVYWYMLPYESVCFYVLLWLMSMSLEHHIGLVLSCCIYSYVCRCLVVSLYVLMTVWLYKHNNECYPFS